MRYVDAYHHVLLPLFDPRIVPVQDDLSGLDEPAARYVRVGLAQQHVQPPLGPVRAGNVAPLIVRVQKLLAALSHTHGGGTFLDCCM